MSTVRDVWESYIHKKYIAYKKNVEAKKKAHYRPKLKFQNRMAKTGGLHVRLIDLCKYLDISRPTIEKCCRHHVTGDPKGDKTIWAYALSTAREPDGIYIVDEDAKAKLTKFITESSISSARKSIIIKKLKAL